MFCGLRVCTELCMDITSRTGIDGMAMMWVHHRKTPLPRTSHGSVMHPLHCIHHVATWRGHRDPRCVPTFGPVQFSAGHSNKMWSHLFFALSLSPPPRACTAVMLPPLGHVEISLGIVTGIRDTWIRYGISLSGVVGADQDTVTPRCSHPGCG